MTTENSSENSEGSEISEVSASETEGNDEHDVNGGSEVEDNDDSNNGDDANDDSSEENEYNSDDEKSKEKKNLAWADAISKILKTKPKPNEPIVLSKAKKLSQVKPKPKPAGFEVELEDGKVKEEVVEESPEKKTEKTQPKRKRKKELPDFRVKPNILQKDREKVLSKIATKGVVQLFNAVRFQQKDIKEKLRDAGPLEVKKAKVMKNIDKNTFLDVLMGEKSQNVDEVLENTKTTTNKTKTQLTKEKEGKVWDVLRDNFMMDAKLKDWDKELEVEEDDEIEME